MKVSVVVIGYNVEKYIFRCINSIINQTYSNIEIIYVDDGSMDNSVNIVNEIKKKDDRIIIVEDNNSGPYNARNHGLDLVTGDYFIFVDGDDWIELNTIQSLIEIVKKNDLNVVLFDYVKNDYINNKLIHNQLPIKNNTIYNRELIKNEILPILMYNSCLSSPCNKFYNTNYIKKLIIRKDVNIRYGEDMIFLLDVFDNLEKTLYVNIEFYHYCINQVNSLSQIHHKDAFEYIIKPLFDIRYSYALKWNCITDLYINTCYLGICEIIYYIKHKNKNYLHILSDRIFLDSLNSVGNKEFYKKFKSKKIFLCFIILKVLFCLKERGHFK